MFSQELYNRQKKNLQNNLHHKDKKSLGETYSKGRGDLRSIIYPYNHPFQQDEVEVHVTIVTNIVNYYKVHIIKSLVSMVKFYIQAAWYQEWDKYV